MKHRTAASASILALMLSTTALHAEVKAQEVWDSWKSLSAGFGQTMTAASETMSGDTLTITGVRVAQDFEGGNMLGTIDEVLMRETRDGTVEITMSPTYPMTINFADPDGTAGQVMMEMRHSGLKLIAGGTAAETTYDITADTLQIATTGVTEAGAPIDLTVEVMANGLAGSYLLGSAGDLVTLTTTATLADIAFGIAAKDPATATDIAAKGTIRQMALSGENTLVGGLEMENMGKALAAGFATSAGITYGAVDFDMNVMESGTTTAVRGTTSGGDFRVAMDKSRIEYAAGGKDMDIVVSGSTIPFPEVALRYAEAAFDFLIPVGKSDAPQPFKAITRIVDLSVSDDIWGMFDPAGTLPRDPATLVVEAGGTATLTQDILDTDQMAALGGMPPGMLNSLDLSALLVRFVGAELSGNGALTFDNSDLTTFNGMPAPTGQIDLKLLGANALIDNLIAMGLLPEDQAMGARMMMGMFARPGTEPDSLTSTLEFKDGGFFANGMRLQ